MLPQHLRITDHRNIARAELTPDPALNVLCGANGQGKTNLLEAIWLLTGGKSFRGSKDADLIRRGAPFSVLEAEFEGAGRPHDLRLTVGGRETKRPGRSACINGEEVPHAAALATRTGAFTAVVFEPDHLNLVKGGPEGRRRFLDTTLCQLYPTYLVGLRRYARIVSQKNAVLKNYDSTPGAADLLETFNAELLRTGTVLIRRRRDYMAKLAPAAARNYSEISRGAETLSVRYLPSVDVEGDVVTALAARLRAVAAAERRAGFCLTGPHREDLEILIDGHPARVYGSQGQQRSAVLALKLAEAAVAGELLEEQPVMLLDDVLSELDDARQTYLLTRIGENQTFVTTCDTAAFARTTGKIFLVDAGRVQEKPD